MAKKSEYEALEKIAYMEGSITIRLNGRSYKKEGGRWFIDHSKGWRPVYDHDRLEVLRQLEKYKNDIHDEMEAACGRVIRKV